MSAESHIRTWRCGPGPFHAALEDLRRFGGRIEGGESEGTMLIDTPAGPLEGRYRFDGDSLTVTVVRKPGLLPIEMIWGRIDRVCGPSVAGA